MSMDIGARGFWKLVAVAAVLGGLAAPTLAASAEVNIYSFRKEALIRPQLDAFTRATGIEVNLLTGSADGLIERLRSEGRNSPADVLLTADAGRLARAQSFGLLQAVRSAALEAAVPAELRDPDGYWFGLSIRARPIFYAKGRVDPSELSTYEDLADLKWRGRVLIRSSSNIYNQSLLAAMIAKNGAAAAEAWANGVKANMARRPQGGDTDQLRALAAGEGDIAIANTYYYGRLLASDDAGDREVAAKIGLFWPNQDGRGTHVNISGGAVAVHAPNRDNAVRLLEFLASDEAQELYAGVNHEFPIRAGIARSAVVSSFGIFVADDLPLHLLGKFNAEAVRIFDRVGWR